jgi:hypothetical protein
MSTGDACDAADRSHSDCLARSPLSCRYLTNFFVQNHDNVTKAGSRGLTYLLPNKTSRRGCEYVRRFSLLSYLRLCLRYAGTQCFRCYACSRPHSDSLRRIKKPERYCVPDRHGTILPSKATPSAEAAKTCGSEKMTSTLPGRRLPTCAILL